jgi:hypothetical protein
MALQMTFTHAGVTVADGYLRVSDLAGTKSSIGFALAYQASAGEDALKHERFSFTPNMSGGNFIAQAYEHLKTLPEFAGAADV